ncbi:MAG: hypothetical protein IKP10_02160 [Clostridia bacterium]|nr:hypothetical protein [Clostridia bacterium]
MKAWLCALLSVLFLLCLLSAAAEDGEPVFNLSALEADESLYCYPDDNGIDTVYRDQSMPWSGACDEGWADVFLDFVELANEDVVALRLSVSVTLDDMLTADRLTFELDGRQWRFAVITRVNEYDQVFMEDYGVCLAGDSLTLLDALAKGGGHTLGFVLEGERTLTGSVTVQGDKVRELRDRWISLGGGRQDMTKVAARWPLLP